MLDRSGVKLSGLGSFRALVMSSDITSYFLNFCSSSRYRNGTG